MAAACGDPDPRTDLEKLAAELDGGLYAISLVTSPGRRPHLYVLYVCNRTATQLTESIYSDGEHFWWGWAERIAPVTSPQTAAAAVERLLRVLGGGR